MQYIGRSTSSSYPLAVKALAATQTLSLLTTSAPRAPCGVRLPSLLLLLLPAAALLGLSRPPRFVFGATSTDRAGKSLCLRRSIRSHSREGEEDHVGELQRLLRTAVRLPVASELLRRRAPSSTSPCPHRRRYYTFIFVGNPPGPYFLDGDTGSDLTCIQCDAPCTNLAKGSHPLYKPTKEKIVPPRNSLCQELQGDQNHCET